MRCEDTHTHKLAKTEVKGKNQASEGKSGSRRRAHAGHIPKMMYIIVDARLDEQLTKDGEFAKTGASAWQRNLRSILCLLQRTHSVQSMSKILSVRDKKIKIIEYRQVNSTPHLSLVSSVNLDGDMLLAKALKGAYKYAKKEKGASSKQILD